MNSIYIDESKAKSFILCAVSLEAHEIPRARSITKQSVMSGQKSIHFVSEGRRRKQHLFKRYSELDLTIDFYIVSAGEMREQALRALVHNLPTREMSQLFLDEDINYTQMDRTVLRRELELSKLNGQVSYTHLTAKSESLLWLPDAFAWCKARGKEWSSQLDRFQTRTHRIG